MVKEQGIANELSSSALRLSGGCKREAVRGENLTEEKGKNDMRVFLVDDSTVIRGWIRRLLSGLRGIEIVGETRDPIKAIHHIRTLKPDAVILDMRVQKRLGIDVLQNLRELTPAPLIIMLTHRFYRSFGSENRASGADFYFDKFTEWHKISDILRPVLGNRAKIELSDLPA